MFRKSILGYTGKVFLRYMCMNIFNRFCNSTSGCDADFIMYCRGLFELGFDSRVPCNTSIMIRIHSVMYTVRLGRNFFFQLSGAVSGTRSVSSFVRSDFTVISGELGISCSFWSLSEIGSSYSDFHAPAYKLCLLITSGLGFYSCDVVWALAIGSLSMKGRDWTFEVIPEPCNQLYIIFAVVDEHKLALACSYMNENAHSIDFYFQFFKKKQFSTGKFFELFMKVERSVLLKPICPLHTIWVAIFIFLKQVSENFSTWGFRMNIV